MSGSVAFRVLGSLAETAGIVAVRDERAQRALREALTGEIGLIDGELVARRGAGERRSFVPTAGEWA